MSLYPSIIDSLVTNLKQSADNVRSFLSEKTISISSFFSANNMNTPSASANFLKEKATNLIADNRNTLGQIALRSNKTAANEVANDNIKQFIINNKESILKLLGKVLGVTVSVTISYLFLKWLINSMDPSSKEKQRAKRKADHLLRKLGMSNINLDEYELLVASNIILPQNIDVTWNDIGGLEHIIDDLRSTCIYPLKVAAKKQSRSRLIQPPKGVLLFGPPGNAKTMIAKALAKESGARFINLQVSTLFDKWYGEPQKRTDAIFSLARKIQPVIIFIDEIDSFLRLRDSVDHECTLMMKTQFMTLWDGISSNDDNRMLIIGATNRPQDVDPAILRRMPAMFYVGLPNYEQRVKILRIILQNESLEDDIKIEEIAMQAVEYSGSDLKELCRAAAMNRFIETMKNKNSLKLDYNNETSELNEDEEEEDENNLDSVKLRKVDFEVAFEKLSVKELTKPGRLDKLIEFRFDSSN